MATTVVPKYDGPITVTPEEIRTLAQYDLEVYRGDEDKSDTVDDANYWEGCANVLEDLLQWMTQPRNTNQGDDSMAEKQTMDKIEKTIDVAEDTLDTLERIPTANLNGTTKDQQVLILGVTAGIGMLVGVLASGTVHKVINKFRRNKNKQIIKEAYDAAEQPETI